MDVIVGIWKHQKMSISWTTWLLVSWHYLSFQRLMKGGNEVANTISNFLYSIHTNTKRNKNDNIKQMKEFYFLKRCLVRENPMTSKFLEMWYLAIWMSENVIVSNVWFDMESNKNPENMRCLYFVYF